MTSRTTVPRVLFVCANNGREARVDPVDGRVGTIEVWHTDEPSERGIEGMERVRLVREDIDQRVRDLHSDRTSTAT